MATLDVTRAYSDGEVLTEAQIDTIRTDIETFFNTTKLNDDNIQNSGITGSTKLADASISTAKLADSSIINAKIQDDAITTSKIIDEAVTAAKIADNAVTAAKLTSLFLPTEEGAIRLIHTFNSTVSIPRGWMILNGDVVNQTNYDAIHGSGSYTTDGVASSNLLSKNLPAFTNIFPVGDSDNDTSQDGSSAITTVGNTDHEIDVSHTHTGNSHTHSPDPAPTTLSRGDDGTLINNTRSTSQSTTFTLASSLSSTFNIKPEAISFIFIIRVI